MSRPRPSLFRFNGFTGGGRRSAATLGLWLLPLLLCAVVLAGCRTPAGPKPGRTQLDARLIELPARIMENLVVVETQWDKSGPWRFLVDTGSSTTLVSPELAAAHATAEAARRMPQVRVRSAEGRTTTLDAVTIRLIQFGDARFERVECLVYDLADLSAHLGMQIDGVLGFPFFRDTILTLDYPRSRLILTPAGRPPLVPGASLGFDAGAKVPLVPVEIEGRTLLVLIDSGSDGPLNLNPAGLGLRFASGPRPGATVGTMLGDRQQQIGRLEGSLKLGFYEFQQPIVDVTDQLSSIGGEILRYFSVTFDQVRGTVTFYRDDTSPIRIPRKRSPGLSFSKTAAYWRVAGVVPGSPAEAIGLKPGDLVVRINGQPVDQWDLARFRRLVETAETIQFTLLQGRTEQRVEVPSFVLVP